LAEEDAGLLANISAYPLSLKNCRYDLDIWRKHLWGGRFQMAELGERQITGENGRSFSGQEVWIWIGYRRVLSLW